MSQTDRTSPSPYTAVNAAELAERFELSDEARPLARPELDTQRFVERLAEAELHADAVKALAHAMPRREAIWWACLCLKQAELPPPQAASLAAAEAWLADPNEANRRAAESAAEAAGLATGAGCVAMAAFWSGGSLAPEGSPVVPPGPHLSAHGAACAVILAAVSARPEEAPRTFPAFLKLGMDVAHGNPPCPRARAPRPDVAASPAPPDPAPRPAAPRPFADPEPGPRAAGPGPFPPQPARPQAPGRPTLNWD